LKSVEVPEGVTKLNNYTFQNCTSLESVKLPEGLTSMGTYVFKGCSALKSVEIPEGVTSIGNYSFQNCSALETVNLPTGLKTLGTYMFDGCSMLKSIAVPEAITTIGNYMFRNCTSLASVTMGSKVTTISQYAFNGCSALQAIELPSTVTSIAQYAFANCSSLKSISVPEGVTTINNYVFQNCSALENVTLGSKVKTLGNYAFNGCAALKVLELPETISTLGKDFVVGATNLTVYVCNATPFSWSNSFKVSSEAYAPIYVVYGAKADYEAAANWNLSAVNEIVPTIAADMENKTVLVDYNNALLQVPVTETYAETVPARFIEANNKALNAEYKTVVKFRKADTEDEYMSVDAELNEDGTFTADLLNYLEEETRYEYYWEITLGENAPVASTLDYFITEGLVTDIDEINVDNNGNAVEYYSIQGVKVDNPEKGIFIKKQGGKTTKVIVK
jgi:hypothetical protein